MRSRSSERVDPNRIGSLESRIIYLEHLFAYESARQRTPPGANVLDIGCGEGYGTALLAEAAGSAVGIDVDSRTISRAAARYGSPNCRFKVYDGTDVPFQPATFDMVVAFQVIEHVQDDRAFVAELSRVLKEDGVVFLTTPERTHRLRPGQRPWNFYHVREYARADLASVLGESFGNVDLRCVSATERILAIENARVRRARRIASLDPLHLRRYLPRPALQVASNLVTAVARPTPRPGADFSTSDFHIEACTEGRGLDLFAVCKH